MSLPANALWCALFLSTPAVFELKAQQDTPPTVNASTSKHFIELKGAQSENAEGFAESPELIKLGPGQPVVAPNGDGQAKYIPVKYFHRSSKAQGAPSTRDPVIQDFYPALNTPNPTANFDGMANIDGYVPPDTVGAIGPSNYVQAVNVRLQVFNRFTGATQTTANPISTLFSSLGTGSLCATTDDGDPIVLYDPYADRWLIAQFANASAANGPYYMSIAISKTGDPTGAYYAYCFQTPGTKFPDYPKFGVWPDGYYMSVNQFNGNSYAGAGVYAFDRVKMLAGDPTATYNYFDLNSVDPNIFGFLPSSADGPPPPTNTPNYFMFLQGTSLGDSANQLRIFQFHCDFKKPALATFTERADSPVSVAAFTAFSPSSLAIPQSGTTRKLDSLGDRLMFRLQYRNFGSNESLVVTHTATGGSGQAGIRYYQLKRPLPSGAFAMAEQATYAPDSLYRWMGSVAVNNKGDLAVGYSVSSSTTFPSVRYAARLATDPPNGLFQGEATMVTGGGAQTDSSGRWGDYSCMTIDPVDDSTFWYTQEYVAVKGSRTWKTRIGSFSLPGSMPAPRSTLHGTITRADTGTIVSNAFIRSSSGYLRFSDGAGNYSLYLPSGTNDYFFEAAGIATNQFTSLVLTNGENRLLNVALGQSALQPSIITNGWTLLAESCLPANGAVDPGETVTVQLSLKNIGFANTTNLTVTLLTNNGVAATSDPQNYGVVSTNGTPGNAAFSFTTVGSCGASIALTFHLQDGASDLGGVSVPVLLGMTAISVVQSFDTGPVPALPVGWSSTATGGESSWVTSTSFFDSAPNSAFSPDTTSIGVNELDSPTLAIPVSQAQLIFLHRYDLESGYDGGVLEMSVNGGGYQDILAAGGSFVTGGYNNQLSTSYGNPLGGRSAWTGNSGGFITTRVNLPASSYGQPAQFRWRCGSDSSIAGTGWYLDSISLFGSSCCTYTPPPSLESLAMSNDDFQFVINGTTGSRYIVQMTTNLTAGTWVPVVTNTAPFTFTETNATAIRERYYRALLAP